MTATSMLPRAGQPVSVAYWDGPRLCRVTVEFTGHALSRYIERHGPLATLPSRVSRGWADRMIPFYAEVKMRTLLETWGFLHLDAHSSFALKRDPDGRVWAVTYLNTTSRRAAA